MSVIINGTTGVSSPDVDVTGAGTAFNADVLTVSAAKAGSATQDFNTKVLTVTGTGASATLGSELTTNGTFTGGTTGWTLGTDWTYGTDNVIFTNNGGAAGTLSQNVSVVSGKKYLIEWSQTNSIGQNCQMFPSLGTVTGSLCAQGVGTVTNSQILTSNTTGSVAFSLTPQDITSTGTVTIDNITIKEITPYAALETIYSAAGASYPTEIRQHWNGVNGPSICIGFLSGCNLTTGYYNTFSGMQAGYFNTTGFYNTFSGSNAGFYNTTGYYNTFSGAYAGFHNTTGYYNTFSGVTAGYYNTTGYYNTFSGMYAGYSNTTGYANTAIGYYAGNTTPGSYLNWTCIGYNTVVTASNQVQLGDAATTTFVYGTVQNRSDLRDKADIRDTTLGLSFIQSLRPVDYRWDMREDYKPVAPEKPTLQKPTDETAADYATKLSAYDAEQSAYKLAQDAWLVSVKHENLVHDGSKKRTRFHHGFIAQEVLELNAGFGGVQDHKLAGGEDVLSIGYDELIAPMVKAIQELKAEFDAYKAAHP